MTVVSVKRRCGNSYPYPHHGLAYGGPHAFEYALHGLGLGADVIIHGLKAGLGHHVSSLLRSGSLPALRAAEDHVLSHAGISFM